MDKNKKIGMVIGGIIILVVVFYAGMSYGKSKATTVNQVAQTNGQGGGRMRNGGGGFTGGQIISKDANSITVQLMNGGPGATGGSAGSKIIFLDSNTKVSKQAAGTIADLTIGAQVSVTGTPNADGSENATSVQIRQNMPQNAKVQ